MKEGESLSLDRVNPVRAQFFIILFNAVSMAELWGKTEEIQEYFESIPSLIAASAAIQRAP